VTSKEHITFVKCGVRVLGRHSKLPDTLKAEDSEVRSGLHQHTNTSNTYIKLFHTCLNILNCPLRGKQVYLSTVQ